MFTSKITKLRKRLYNKTFYCVYSNYTSNAPSKTALFNLHEEFDAKIINFGGFLLPVQYGKESITASHVHTRNKCSIFDVSHMLQTEVHGNDRKEFIERITTADVQNLAVNKGCLTVFTNTETGGILDDLIVTNTSQGYLYVVSNAGRREHDQGLMMKTQQQMKLENKDVEVNFLDLDKVSLIAVQGPQTQSVVQQVCDVSLDNLTFMTSTIATVDGVKDCRVTRCGYTGEDGVEISVPSEHVDKVVKTLLKSNRSEVKLAGLGARDSLRLEAGLCLYGSDIDETVTPVEAALMWLVAKSRREKKDFPGANVILKKLKDGPKMKRIGLKLDKGPSARHDCAIKTDDGLVIGHVTSGCPSPSLGGAVAMGYVDVLYTKPGTRVLVEVRGRDFPATVHKMPFLPTNYYSGVK